MSAGGVLGCPVLGSGVCGAGERDRALGSSHAGWLRDRPAAEVTTEWSSGRHGAGGRGTAWQASWHGVSVRARGAPQAAQTRVPAALRGALQAGPIEVGSDPTVFQHLEMGRPVA